MAKELKDKTYYSKHFEENIVAKIDNKEGLIKDELSKIRCFSIEDNYLDNKKCTCLIRSILKMCNRYFMLYWDKGLTERQENEFYVQPYEVEKNSYKKTTVVTKWVIKNEKRKTNKGEIL